MSAVDAEPFPKPALYAAAALIGLTIVITGVARMEKILYYPTPVRAVAPVASLDLRFVDEANGGLTAREVGTDRVVATLAPGTNGFVRTVMRGLVRTRHMKGIGPGPAFRLFEEPGGRVYMKDTATGQVIDLQAFGMSNRDAFKVFLHPGMVVS